MSQWIGSGFVQIIVYGTQTHADTESSSILTEDNFELMTEDSRNLLTEDA